jgi:hypothetical protein
MAGATGSIPVAPTIPAYHKAGVDSPTVRRVALGSYVGLSWRATFVEKAMSSSTLTELADFGPFRPDLE